MPAVSINKLLQNTDIGLNPFGARVDSSPPLAQLFDLCNTDQSEEYLPVRRSVRIHGHSTTLRLEKAFWTVLEVLAKEEGTTVAELVTRIHDHCLVANQKNLASCLRVVCLKYINLCY
ncbi:MAG: ribbon-helix-helix domain-containing protein [Rhodospirillales bacterium]|nr:ribbon-helix-helix domain-containing protein [Rhodospirillales bacterium]